MAVTPAVLLLCGAAAAAMLGALAVVWKPSRWIVLLFAMAWLLPPLPLPFGDTGPHPALLFAAGLGLLLGLARLGEWRIEPTLLNVCLLAFLAALVFSVGLAVLHSGAFLAAMSTARIMLFGISLYVFFSVSQGPDRIGVDARHVTRALYGIALAAALFGCIDFLYQLPAPAGYEPQFIWLDSGIYRRAQGLFYEASTLGNFCAFFLVMIAVSLTEPKTRRTVPLWALVPGAVVFGTALLASYSRASVLTVIVALLVLAIVERKRWAASRAAIGLTAAGAGVVVSAIFLSSEFAQSYWARLVLSFESFFAAPDRVLSGRLRELADDRQLHRRSSVAGFARHRL